MQRFVLYAQLLRRIEWDCAFAIDLSDVVMLNVPPCHALPRRLVIGSDAEAPWFRTWLNKAARINGLRGNVSIPLRAYLNGSRPALHLNVGVLGGCRAALVPLLDRVVRKFETHWSASFKRNISAASDMVLWNDLGAELSEESTPPLTGYPYGPVNMPMYGGSNPGSCLARYFRNSTGRHTNPCRTRWFNETQGMFWFAHKPVKSWITEFMDPKSRKYLRIVRGESVGKKKRPVWLPMCVHR